MGKEEYGEWEMKPRNGKRIGGRGIGMEGRDIKKES